MLPSLRGRRPERWPADPRHDRCGPGQISSARSQCSASCRRSKSAAAPRAAVIRQPISRWGSPARRQWAATSAASASGRVPSASARARCAAVSSPTTRRRFTASASKGWWSWTAPPAAGPISRRTCRVRCCVVSSAGDNPLAAPSSAATGTALRRRACVPRPRPSRTARRASGRAGLRAGPATRARRRGALRAVR